MPEGVRPAPPIRHLAGGIYTWPACVEITDAEVPLLLDQLGEEITGGLRAGVVPRAALRAANALIQARIEKRQWVRGFERRLAERGAL